MEDQNSPYIGDWDVSSMTVKNPVKSGQDATTFNAYFRGGGRSFTFNEMPEALINPDASAEDRDDALDSVCVQLGETHLIGGQYSSPEDNEQPLLVMVPEEALPKLFECDEWVKQTVFDSQTRWKMQPKSREIMDDLFVPLASKNKNKQTGEVLEESSYAVSMKMYKTGKSAVQVWVQSPDSPEEFDQRGTMSDVTSGARIGIVATVSGIRLRKKDGNKAKDFSLTKPIVKIIYVFTKGGGTAAPAAFSGGSKIKFSQHPEDPAAPAAAGGAAAAADDAEVDDGAAAVAMETETVTPNVAEAAVGDDGDGDDDDDDNTETLDTDDGTDPDAPE